MGATEEGPEAQVPPDPARRRVGLDLAKAEAPIAFRAGARGTT